MSDNTEITKKKIDFIPKQEDIKIEDGDHVLIKSKIDLIDKDTEVTVYFPGERQDVIFNINIPDAKVTIITPNGVMTGTSFKLRRGKYKYEINHPKYKIVKGEIHVTDKSQTINITLELIQYNLTITTIPDDCKIELYQGNSWTTVGKTNKLNPGLYRYRVSKDGYVSKENMVNILNDDVTIIVELEQIKQLLKFITIPEKATVEVMINSSWTMGKEHNIVPGNYRYKVTCDGYVTVEDTIEIPSGQSITTKTVTLSASNFDLIFDITPNDATIEVEYNGKWNTGKTHNLPNGTYQFKITKEGYVPIQEGVVINNGNKTIKKVMEKVLRLVTFNVNPSDATCELEIEGIYKKGKNHNVSPGNYNWRITKPGYNERTGNIEVTTENVIINENLEAVLYDVTINVMPSNAQVRIKDKSNNWNNTKTIKLPNGIYDYECLLTGYTPIKKQFEVKNNNVEINEVMENIKYTLHFDITPSNATIEVEVKGSWLMGNDHRLEEGLYKYRVSRLGYDTKEGQVLIDDNKSITVVLEKKKYRVTINKNPIDAIFKIQKGSTFETVSGNYIELTNDVYNWICSKDHYIQKNGSVTVYGENTNVDVTLEKMNYTLSVNTTPEDAKLEVRINGDWVHKPNKTFDLPYGNYDIRVSKDGFTTKEETVILDSTKAVSIVLEGKKYTLTINKTPTNAIFKINKTGSYEIVNGGTIELSNGSYDWICEKNNYIQKTGTVIINNAPNNLNVTLTPVNHTLTVTTVPNDAKLEIKINEIWTVKDKTTSLPHGVYEIRVTKDGYKTITDIITLHSDLQKSYTMETDNCSLTITTSEGVNVEVDIAGIKTTNVLVFNNIAKNTLIKIYAYQEGKKPYNETFNINSNEIRHIVLTTGLIYPVEITDFSKAPIFNSTYNMLSNNYKFYLAVEGDTLVGYCWRDIKNIQDVENYDKGELEVFKVIGDEFVSVKRIKLKYNKEDYNIFESYGYSENYSISKLTHNQRYLWCYFVNKKEPDNPKQIFFGRVDLVTGDLKLIQEYRSDIRKEGARFCKNAQNGFKNIITNMGINISYNEKYIITSLHYDYDLQYMYSACIYYLEDNGDIVDITNNTTTDLKSFILTKNPLYINDNVFYTMNNQRFFINVKWNNNNKMIFYNSNMGKTYIFTFNERNYTVRIAKPVIYNIATTFCVLPNSEKLIFFPGGSNYSYVNKTKNNLPDFNSNTNIESYKKHVYPFVITKYTTYNYLYNFIYNIDADNNIHIFKFIDEDGSFDIVDTGIISKVLVNELQYKNPYITKNGKYLYLLGINKYNDKTRLRIFRLE